MRGHRCEHQGVLCLFRRAWGHGHSEQIQTIPADSATLKMDSRSSDFARLMEVDIGDTSGIVDLPPKRKRSDSSPENLGPGPPSSLYIHFSPSSPLRSRGQRYRWVSQVLRTEPFKHIKGALELRNGRQNIYVKCKDIDILTRLTTTGALGEVLVRPRVFGKQQEGPT